MPITLDMSRYDVLDRAREIGEQDARSTLAPRTRSDFARKLAVAQIYGYSTAREYRAYIDGYTAHAW